MRKVIVQDTNDDLLETMRIILEDAEYEVLAISSYRDVLNSILSFQPHLVLIDFMLTGEEAAALCQQIKKNYADLPVLAMSCSTHIEYAYALAGFDDYIAKPFDLEYLFKVLGKYGYSQ